MCGVNMILIEYVFFLELYNLKLDFGRSEEKKMEVGEGSCLFLSFVIRFKLGLVC